MLAKLKKQLTVDLARANAEQIEALKALWNNKKTQGDEDAEEALTMIEAFEKENAEPADVKVVALHDTIVDGTRLTKGQEATVTKRQFAALAHRLKQVTCIAVLFGLLFGAMSVRAQYRPLIAEGGTNGIAAATGGTAFVDTTVTNLLPFVKSRFIGLQISYTNSTVCAFSSNAVFCFAKSLDGSPDSTNTPSNINITVASRTDNNTRAQLTTNIDLGAIGYLTLICRTNFCTNQVTNVVIKYVDASNKP